MNNAASNLQFLYFLFLLPPPLFARHILKYVALIKTKLQSFLVLTSLVI